MQEEKSGQESQDVFADLAFSWSTTDSLGQRLSFESMDEKNEVEERIIQYLNDRNIECFTDPTLKEKIHTEKQKERIVSTSFSLCSIKNSSLLSKRSLLHL